MRSVGVVVGCKRGVRCGMMEKTMLDLSDHGEDGTKSGVTTAGEANDLAAYAVLLSSEFQSDEGGGVKDGEGGGEDG